MSPDELKTVLGLLSGGGNAALVALALLGWKIWKGVEVLLVRIADKLETNRAEAKADAEAIKRAIIARDPSAARHFDKPAQAG